MEKERNRWKDSIVFNEWQIPFLFSLKKQNKQNPLQIKNKCFAIGGYRPSQENFLKIF